MPDVFLSYSREDQATARLFAEGLEREGLGVWWDQALSAGESFDRVTEKALDEAKAVVVLWSKRSVQSDWVRAEATQARANHRLVPVMIEPCRRPIMFELTHTADLSDWKGDANDPAWRAYVTDVRRFVYKGETTTAPDSIASAEAHRSPLRSALPWVAAIAALVIAAGVFWHFQGTPTDTPAAELAASVAVLPFRDMSQNKDQEYFADGVTEEILNSLAGIKDLEVTARTSAFAFKGKDVDLREVGETLGVRYILEGSIRKDGEQLRITAQLIDARTDAHLWSRTYDRPLQDIFKVQEDIARSVAEALQVSLGVGFGNQPGMTRDVDAYDAYLAANNLLLQYNSSTQRRAIELLEQAVATDPAFGKAWNSLTNAYVGMASVSREDPVGWQRKADASLAQLQRLLPDSTLVHRALAERSINQGRWKDAAGHYRNLSASQGDGRFLMMVGRAAEARGLLEQERARDPLNVLAIPRLTVAYAATGNFPAAFAESERGFQLGGVYRGTIALSTVYLALGAGDPTLAGHWMDRGVEANPGNSQFAKSRKQMLEHPAEALADLHRQTNDPSLAPLARSNLAPWLAYFGDAQAALDALRAGLNQGTSAVLTLNLWHPVYRDVRKLPGFKQLVRDIGLVEYWRAYTWGDFCRPTTGDDFECT